MRPALHVLLGAVLALPVGVDVDYQLGGVRDVPARVGIVVRDRAADPLPDHYNVCYVNGFQTQPDEKRFWRERWGLVSSGRAARSSTRRGVSGCSTFVRRASGRGWPASSAAGPRDAPRTASTRWSSTISTRSRAAGACCDGDTRRRTPDCWSAGRTRPGWRSVRRISRPTTERGWASTSRWPRSAGVTGSVGTTGGTSGAGCSSLSTGARTSAQPVPAGAVASRSSCGTAT